MQFWRYGYTDKEGKSRNMLIKESTRVKADAAFVARTGIFVADIVEKVREDKLITFRCGTIPATQELTQACPFDCSGCRLKESQGDYEFCGTCHECGRQWAAENFTTGERSLGQ